MKWIKTAIGALIAIMSIGIIATSVYKMTQASEVIREVSFEITNFDEVDSQTAQFFPISAYDDILKYGVIVENENVPNVTVYIDDEISEIAISIDVDYDMITLSGDIPDSIDYIDSYITSDGVWHNDGGQIDYDVVVKLIFEVAQPPHLTGTTATLILLTPLIFTGGFLIYLLRKQNY